MTGRQLTARQPSLAPAFPILLAHFSVTALRYDRPLKRCHTAVVCLSCCDRVPDDANRGCCLPIVYSFGDCTMRNLNKVREYRLARAWSQEQLAEMAGLSTRTVQRIENGDPPSLETLSALAAVFACKITDLTSEASAENGEALDSYISDARLQLAAESRFYRSLFSAVVVCTLLFVLNHFTSPNERWSLWVAAIWGALLVVRALRLFIFKEAIRRWQQRRLQKLLRRQG
ncbi:Hypothetical Protein PANA_3040 [Pantoea ananatis LMG 20103]|uniref:HTH cro/C1-type domain-containing protein n=2 Tax=Pantoea ananas TaxID=553 RepID=D4GLF4_PANAM|nr:Hypothetical Protein PANA_3040 [Pantoea ananatis LMG 20103]